MINLDPMPERLISGTGFLSADQIAVHLRDVNTQVKILKVRQGHRNKRDQFIRQDPRCPSASKALSFKNDMPFTLQLLLLLMNPNWVTRV
jgi:hypothetical protein